MASQHDLGAVDGGSFSSKSETPASGDLPFHMMTVALIKFGHVLVGVYM
jgi:hypothetical protein